MPRIEKPAIATEEHQAVVAHVEKYVRSLLKPDIDTLKQCFHNDGGTIFGVMNQSITGGHIQALYDVLESDGGLPALEWTINVLAITQTTAIVQVVLFQESPRYEVTDSLSLLKPPTGKWTIVNKVFEMYQYVK